MLFMVLQNLWWGSRNESLFDQVMSEKLPIHELINFKNNSDESICPFTVGKLLTAGFFFKEERRN